MNEKKPANTPGVVKTRVLVVDDNLMVRNGLKKVIKGEAELTMVVRASSAAQAVRAVKRHSIDIAIVDMRLKDTTGIQVTEQIKSACPGLIVLVFSMSDQMLHVQQAFRAGARGYILKDELSEKIVYAIRQLLEGKTYLSKQLSKRFKKLKLHTLLAEESISLDIPKRGRTNKEEKIV